MLLRIACCQCGKYAISHTTSERVTGKAKHQCPGTGTEFLHLAAFNGFEVDAFYEFGWRRTARVGGCVLCD
jgi:hypothetical protein